jgi:hypothetical protein
MQAGIVNVTGTFSESFASASDYAHVYVVARIQHISLCLYVL